MARVPALGIEVIAPDLAELDKLLEKEILAALRREGTAKTWRPLAGVQRALKFKVEWQTLDVKLPTLKQRAQREEDESGEEKPSVLKQVATLLDPDRLAPAFEIDETVEQIADALTAAAPAERAARRPERGRQDGRGSRAGPPAGRLPPRGHAVLPDERGPDRGRPVRVRHVAGALHGPRPRGGEEAGRRCTWATWSS